jgi:hypothetical protein
VDDRQGTQPEVEHRAVVDGVHPPVTAQGEGLAQLLAEDVPVGICPAESGKERLGVADGGDLREVDDDRHLREQVESCEVVLVSMGDGDELDVRARSTSSIDLEGGVDQDGAIRPADQQRVAGRLAAALWRGEERDASVLHIGLAHSVLPGRAVGSPPAYPATPPLRRTAEPATPVATPPSAPPR